MPRQKGARFGVWATGALLCAALFAGACSAPRPRNVLIVTLDTTRADRLPPYGFTSIATPALERIAAEGALFEQAFASVPLTLPSHASLFTGLLPPRLGVRDNAGAPLAADFQTLAEILRGRGMATGAFVSSAVLAPGRGVDQGFETYSLGVPAACAGSSHARRRADQVVDEALAWIGARGSGPFFAWLHFYDTHRPYRLPDEYTRGYEDQYAAAIAFEDAQLQRLIDRLEALRHLDETLLVVVGDHGESLGGHGEDSHGIFIYQEALHVPLMLRGPGVVPRRVNAAVRVADVMPTVLDLLGIETPAMDGASMTPLLDGASERTAREVYAESLYPQRFGWASLHSLRAGQYKVIDAPRPELFDLAADPGEQRNLVESNPALAAAMLRRLRSFGAEAARTDTPPSLDPAVSDRIASLGYVSGAPVEPSGPSGAQPDPKDVIETFNLMTRMQWERGAGLRRHTSTCPSATGSM
jgi:arylsulfatase A-like enzyme